jgi:hypothetical protein
MSGIIRIFFANKVGSAEAAIGPFAPSAIILAWIRSAL